MMTPALLAGFLNAPLFLSQDWTRAAMFPNLRTALANALT
jgi:hypothetical protein